MRVERLPPGATHATLGGERTAASEDATVGAMSELHDIAVRMLSEGRGILAADETPGTIGGRFEKLGISSSEETRAAYRELLVTTPGLSLSLIHI